MSILKRHWLALSSVLVLSTAGALAFLWPQENGLGVDIDGSAQAQAARQRDPYDLTRLRVLRPVVLQVKDKYVDPSRIDWRRMFLAGLNGIQRTVAPVIVEYTDGAATCTVQVNDDRQTFRVVDVTTVWALTERYAEVFAFLQTHLGDEEGLKLRDVEYAAANGILHTLDPHTILLTPETFEEMQMSTRGEFGGLGIVISIRDGHLTVIKPMPNTPASRAGIERGDRIEQINDESTMNMPLSEAVDRLRGAPGSRVDAWVSRRAANGSWSARRRIQLVRAVIHIESVEHRMLANNVGYVKINSFQGNTHEDLLRALADLHNQNLESLVLDLRGNPGGLLDQAVHVADTFLSSGTIVSTRARRPEDREVHSATARGTEPNYPMVVLVNGGSASASEIVAGALKNHDRALIVGERSFGKGSVQILYNLPDNAALKLTIAQYLTPGEVSIQGVGIVPDIAIDPMTVDRNDMDLEIDEGRIREANLRSHLTHETALEGQRSATVLRYYLPVEARRRLAEADEREENEQEAEFLTRFSQTILSRARRPRRQDMLRDAQPVIDQTRQQELARAEQELTRLGVDWTVGPDRGASDVTVVATTDHPNDTVTAGDTFKLRVRVTNNGTAPLYQLRAVTKSDYPVFAERELVFGRLDPGQTREWETNLMFCTTENEERTCRVPRFAEDRADAIRLVFQEAHGHAPPEAAVRTTIRSLERPGFSYAVHVADDQSGNGDGRLQRGERASVWFHLKNAGTGRTYTTEVNLRSTSGRGVLLREGRFREDDIAPGQERIVRFGFEVLPDFEPDVVKLEVSVSDTDLREGIVHRFEVPIAPTEPGPTARGGVTRIRAGANVRAQPSPSAAIIARARPNSVASIQAGIDGWVRIDLGRGEPAWVASSDLETGRGAATPAFDFVFSEHPPRLELDLQGMLVTRDANLRLRGRATDETRVRDVYVFSGISKVFYRSNAHAENPREIALDANIPLHDGMNYVNVIVRETDDVVTRRTLVIRRDGPNGEILRTPEVEDDLFGAEDEE